jgi:oligopeptide/dipeptide ABC transporter ATP-binding protein
LRVHFRTKAGVGKAIDGVDLEIRRGETLGLVGESGSGKSLTALAILGLHPRPASRIVGGQILFDGIDLTRTTSREIRSVRGKRIAMILQDPVAALNPMYSIGYQVGEAPRLHLGLRGRKLKDLIVRTLALMRIPQPEARLGSYPHQFSGGMRQRVGGAIALSCGPELLIADEPTTSLDVTIEAAFLQHLQDIQRRSNMAVLFITHDLGIVGQMCDRVAVMYAGKVVETAPTWELFDHPKHPYTEALLRSVPDVRHGTTRLPSIPGQPPSIYNVGTGCPFAARCSYVMARCHVETPPPFTIQAGHTARCWRYA